MPRRRPSARRQGRSARLSSIVHVLQLAAGPKRHYRVSRTDIGYEMVGVPVVIPPLIGVDREGEPPARLTLMRLQPGGTAHDRAVGRRQTSLAEDVHDEACRVSIAR